MSEFYVGYLPKAPAGIARRVRTAVAMLFFLATIGAIAFASVQRGFAPSAFEYGKERKFEGVIEQRPFPTLIVVQPGSADAGSSRYLLVAAGKHGADQQIAGFAGKKVQLRGTLIYRENQKMIELVSGSIAALGDAGQARSVTKDLGTFELTGEIVDGKCYLGVMNPGNGKVHRDCAVRCLSGGIPPIFATNNFNGSPAVLLLAGSNQKPLSKEAFLGRVAQPLRIRGRVTQNGDTLFLETEPSAISSLP